MQLSFLGGAETVTGSRYLLESNSGHKILVDCGLFQGVKNLRLRNWDKFPVYPKKIDAVILTHAHLDHSGYLPKLYREGFRGPVYCTPATAELCEILLLDSAKLKEEDAEFANRKKFSKHKPAKPLYTEDEALKVLSLLEPLDFNEGFKVKDFKFSFHRAGHILGAASVLVKCDSRSVLFSGDVGRPDDGLMPAPDKPPEADYIVMESTYGDRLHEELDINQALKSIIEPIKQNKAVLLIPSFAVGRAQAMLYYIYQLFQKYPQIKMPVYLNSPMATEVTDLYHSFLEDHNLSKQECKEVCNSAMFINSVTESKRLNETSGPMIIIAASGMLVGGRILHHLKAFAGDPKNHILLVGFQTPGTRGASLVHGEKALKMHGQYIDIRSKVTQLDVFSAHADQKELIEWLGSVARKPKKVFLVHGEKESSDALRKKIEEELGFDTEVACKLETIELE